MMKQNIIIIACLLLLKSTAYGILIQNVTGTGSCAIVGMQAEQSQQIALQRARVNAIEKASGLKIYSSTVVTNSQLVFDYIKSFTNGVILNEEVSWEPLNQYQFDDKMPPIPEYRVKITADVYIPKKNEKIIYLEASLNKSIFRNGEKAILNIKTNKNCLIAIFNFLSNGNISMIFPNHINKNNLIVNEFIYPDQNESFDLIMGNLEGHNKDIESFLIVAVGEKTKFPFLSIFTPFQQIPIDKFYNQYYKIVDESESVILPYEIIR